MNSLPRRRKGAKDRKVKDQRGFFQEAPMEPGKVIMLQCYKQEAPAGAERALAKDEFSWKIKVEDFFRGLFSSSLMA